MLSAPRRSRLAQSAGTIAAIAVLAFGFVVLLTYSGLVPLAIDEWPRRPPPQTALCFVLAGTSLALIRQSKNRLSMVADGSVMGLAAVVLFLLGSYVFQATDLIPFDTSNYTSPQTLFCLSLLAFVIATRRAQDGALLAILVNKGIGSQIARIVLPGIVVMPFLMFSVIGYLNENGILRTLQTRAIAAPLMALVAFGVVAWMGQRTNELERQLRQQSLTDKLSNVLNRRGFDTVADYVLRSAQRTETGLVAFYFDLDGLKRANDDFGHDAGSLLIKRFAEILVATFRKNDVVARLGGDEFVVLAAGASVSAAVMLARLAHSVAESNATGSVPGGISYSAGYAELLPGSDIKIDELVAQADAIMYEQKSRKKAA
jgi:diguanylate cyclase (GGDEF)-like protein